VYVVCVYMFKHTDALVTYKSPSSAVKSADSYLVDMRSRIKRRELEGDAARDQRTTWLLHHIVITNIVWCMAYKREVDGGVVYRPILVQ